MQIFEFVKNNKINYYHLLDSKIFKSRKVLKDRTYFKNNKYFVLSKINTDET